MVEISHVDACTRGDAFPSIVASCRGAGECSCLADCNYTTKVDAASSASMQLPIFYSHVDKSSVHLAAGMELILAIHSEICDLLRMCMRYILFFFLYRIAPDPWNSSVRRDVKMLFHHDELT